MQSNEKGPAQSKKKRTVKPLTREEELLKENEYLRAEVAYLKKLQALVQAEARQADKSESNSWTKAALFFRYASKVCHPGT